MEEFCIKKGLNLFKDTRVINIEKKIDSIHSAISLSDFPLARTKILVKEGDKLKAGEPILKDRDINGLNYTLPFSGEIIEVNRGEKKKALSIVIKIDDKQENKNFDFSIDSILESSKEEILNIFLETGLWSLIRQRPFDIIPQPAQNFSALIINALDSSPGAISQNIIIKEYREEVILAINILRKIFDCPIYLTEDGNTCIKGLEQIESKIFTGVHPYGNVGTQIHKLGINSSQYPIAYINAENLVPIGYFFSTGQLFTRRLISFFNTKENSVQTLNVNIGADLQDISKDMNIKGRLISGSLLYGRKVEEKDKYLGQFHRQITVLPENDKRELLGWAIPNFIKKIFKYNFINTNCYGGVRSIVPINDYDKIFPFDFATIPLLRALAIGDLIKSVEYGALELGEEDLSLVTYICPSKIDYTKALRDIFKRYIKEEM